MDDLDSLLEDLGRASIAKKNDAPSGSGNRPASSFVDLNELEDLMADLASADPALSAPASESVRVSTLDFGLDDLQDASGGNSAGVSEVPEGVRVSSLDFGLDDLSAATPTPAPVAATPAPAAAPVVTDDDDDLDALMASLSAAPQPAAVPPPRESALPPVSAPPTSLADIGASASAPVTTGGDDLDSLLGALGGQMQDVSDTNAAGRSACAKCNSAIIGEVLQALGRSYHPQHFTCRECKRALGTEDFFEVEGDVACVPCHTRLYASQCGKCQQAITDKCITALGKKWHEACFVCGSCNTGFPTGAFYSHDNTPYCEGCFQSKMAPKCGKCTQPIAGDCVNAMGKSWHPACFVCATCTKSFSGGTFFESSGLPYCEQHYHASTGSVCGGCGKAITGQSVDALGKKFHAEHFVCTFCMNPLAGGSYTEEKGKAYCKPCYAKLFS
jgi:paxillin